MRVWVTGAWGSTRGTAWSWQALSWEGTVVFGSYGLPTGMPRAQGRARNDSEDRSRPECRLGSHNDFRGKRRFEITPFPNSYFLERTLLQETLGRVLHEEVLPMRFLTYKIARGKTLFEKSPFPKFLSSRTDSKSAARLNGFV